MYLACFQMAADNEVSGDERLGWPGDLAKSKVDPVNSLPALVRRFIDYDYMKAGDVGSHFSYPGLPIYSGQGPFRSEHSIYKIYKVTEDDPALCLFSATKNFTYGHSLNPAIKPFRDKGCVLMRKGGDGLTLGPEQAGSREKAGLLPGGAEEEDAGPKGNVWQ